MTVREAWTAPEACRAGGCSYRELDYWARTGVVRPSVEANGSGTKRFYARPDLDALALLVELRDAGLELKRAARIVRRLREATGRDAFKVKLSAAVVVTVDMRALRVVVDERLAELPDVRRAG